MPEIFTIDQPPGKAPPTGWATLPPAAILIVVVEFWERFSYYGLMAILILFLTAEPAAGGMGWPLAHALSLLALFNGIAWTSPLVGGAIADRWLGSRASVTVGAWLLMLGNVTLVFAAWPRVAGGSTREAVLVGGLGLIAAGNAMLKSTLVVLLGDVFDRHGGRTDGSYAYYYMGVTLGGLAALLVVGYLAARFGWAAGFACAAAGMAVALLLLLIRGPALLGDAGRRVPRRLSTQTELAPTDRRALRQIALFAAFLIVFAVGWVQMQGLWLYEIANSVDRHVFGFDVPPSWVLAINPLIVIAGAPLLPTLWRMATRKGQEPSFGQRFIIGFLLMSAAHAMLAAGFLVAPSTTAMLVWPIVAIALASASELIVWPSSYGMVQRLAPATLKAALMGGWIAMLGIGQYIAHNIAALAEEGNVVRFSFAIAAAMLGGAAALRVCLREQGPI